LRLDERWRRQSGETPRATSTSFVEVSPWEKWFDLPILNCPKPFRTFFNVISWVPAAAVHTLGMVLVFGAETRLSCGSNLLVTFEDHIITLRLVNDAFVIDHARSRPSSLTLEWSVVFKTVCGEFVFGRDHRHTRFYFGLSSGQSYFGN
jgi:hypothetical protein